MVHCERDRRVLHPRQRSALSSFPSLLIPDKILTYISRTTQFYCAEHVAIGENYARFAFCKDLDTLRRAGERLQRLREFVV